MSDKSSNKSLVDLGLLLTGKAFYMKTKLKQINPTLIYQWQGQAQNTKISGKGTFRVKNSLNNQLVYQCTVKQWSNGVPIGMIKFTKINYFTNSQIADYKVKQIQSYEGLSQNLKKHGKGLYKIQQFYSSGKVKSMKIKGQWSYDILIQGVLQDQFGIKQLNLSKNIEWNKSLHSIKFQSDQNLKSISKIMQKKENNNELTVQKKDERVLKEKYFINNVLHTEKQEKLLNPLEIK